jgi:hypothetical protein
MGEKIKINKIRNELPNSNDSNGTGMEVSVMADWNE